MLFDAATVSTAGHCMVYADVVRRINFWFCMVKVPAVLHCGLLTQTSMMMQAPVMGGMAGPDSQTLGAGDLHTAKSRLGLAYEVLPKGQQTSLLGGSQKTAVLSEVEVYFAPEIAALY